MVCVSVFQCFSYVIMVRPGSAQVVLTIAGTLVFGSPISSTFQLSYSTEYSSTVGLLYAMITRIGIAFH